jgi:predicted nucleic acid-binding protein
VAELANAMWVKVRRNELDTSRAFEALDIVRGQTRLQLRPFTPLIPRAFELAQELNHSPYDCVYLALAESLDMPLVTADQRFATVASREHPRVRLLGHDPL